MSCRVVISSEFHDLHTHSPGFSFIHSVGPASSVDIGISFCLCLRRDKYRQHSINYYCVCVRRRRRRCHSNNSTENPLTTKGYPNQIWWVLGMTVSLPSAAVERIDRLILINCTLEIETFTCWF